MATRPPVPPPPAPASAVNDWKAQRRYYRDQAKWQAQQIRMQQRALRQRSLVGPVLLVALGVVFLLAEFDHLHWITGVLWFGRWWPVLLIAAGAVRLAEWSMDQHAASTAAANGQPYLRTRVIGGGAVWLIVLIAVLGGLSQLTAKGFMHANEHGWYINGDDFNRMLGDPHDSDDALTHTIRANGTATFDDPHGNISVAGTSDDGQMHIAVHKQVYAMNDGEASSKAAQMQPSVGGDADHVYVSVPEMTGAHADLTVEVPRGVAVIVTSDHGDISVSGLHAAVQVNGNHGNVSISGIDGEVTAHLHSSEADFAAHSVTGSVTVDGKTGDVNITDISGPVSLNGEFFGTPHFERINGDIRFKSSRTDLHLARLDGELEFDGDDMRGDQILGPLTLVTRNRNVSFERVQGASKVTNRNGSVSLTATSPLDTIEIENQHGSVDLGLPAQAGFLIRADTKNGSLENDFSLPNSGFGDHPAIQGTVGRGGPVIHVETTQGDVTLRKSSAEPLPPSPPKPPVFSGAPVPAPPTPPAAPKLHAKVHPVATKPAAPAAPSQP